MIATTAVHRLAARKNQVYSKPSADRRQSLEQRTAKTAALQAINAKLQASLNSANLVSVAELGAEIAKVALEQAQSAGKLAWRELILRLSTAQRITISLEMVDIGTGQ